jgi:hypothetical protein
MFSILDVDFVNALWFVLGITWIVVTVFWLLVMQRALELVVPNNTMPAGNVWLTFIPFFGLYWQFEVVQKVADSLGEEYRRRGIISREARPGFGVGLTANILLCCAFIPSFGILIAIVSNISRLIHLFRIKNYTADLEEIIRTQMQYAQEPPPAVDFQQYVNPDLEKELKQNNPNRFLPPETDEEIEKRWRRK